MLLTWDRSSVLGSAVRVCGAQRQKLNNLISSPLFTSPPPPHLLSFPRICLLAILPSCLSALSSLESPRTSSPSPSFVLKPHFLSFPHSGILQLIHPLLSYILRPLSPPRYIPPLFLVRLGSPISPQSAHISKP